MKWFWRALLVVIVLAGLGALWLLAGHREAAAPPSQPVAAATLANPALIARGAYLATLGDCAACHTAQGGAAYAGGRSLPTPFGEVPAPNLTPDPATGLGQWSFDDFWGALHEGRGRGGRALYPAFPYTSYTKVSRDDALALFAYLKSLPPVNHATPPPALRFPYDLRASLATWRALYFRPGAFVPDPTQSAQWNRGAYLVEGLGHCNECHVARDELGGLPRGQSLTGGQIPAQNWFAPDLSTQANGGLQGWSEADIVNLLKTGQSAKGAAFGPMAEVIMQSTQHLRDDDLQAIARYLQSLPARPHRRATPARWMPTRSCTSATSSTPSNAPAATARTARVWRASTLRWTATARPPNRAASTPFASCCSAALRPPPPRTRAPTRCHRSRSS